MEWTELAQHIPSLSGAVSPQTVAGLLSFVIFKAGLNLSSSPLFHLRVFVRI